MAQQKIISEQLSASGVTAGSYTSANITVDSAGRITQAEDGSAGGSSTIFTISLNAEELSFDGNPFTTWSSNSYLTASYCHWDSGLNQIVFDESGYYRISIIANVVPATDWPTSIVSFGTTVSEAEGRTNTRHSAFSDAYPENFVGLGNFTGAPNQSAAVWTDTYIISAVENSTQSIGVYAASYSAMFDVASLSAFVTVERLGQGV